MATGVRVMRNTMPGRLRGRCTRWIAWSIAAAMLVVAGCAQLAEKERELTFRVVPGTASWFGGLPAGVQESDLVVEADGKPQRIHAWWWPAVAKDLAARLSKAAAQAGTAVPAHGLIVESSFTTLADIARAVTSPLLPVFLLSQKFDSLAKVHELRMPVLFVHGAGDSYVPSRFSQELYQAAPEPNNLLLVDGATHNNCMRVGSAEYLAAIHQLFSVEAPAPMRQARRSKS